MTRIDEEREAALLAAEVARRAARRLDVLEWVGFAGAALAATFGGWLIAVVAAPPPGVAFRTVWIAASVLLLGVPGGVVLLHRRRVDREIAERTRSREESDG